jgi:serine/threonine-protein kinase
MLGDLRKRLQPLGRLDALDVVGERALAYYAAQDAARLDADSLGRRARALHLIGEIAERRGQLAEAARRFESASFSTAELLARAPADGQRIYDHAQSEYWVGFIARRRGELAQAEAAMEQYLALATRLHAQPGAAHEWLLELPFAQQNLGVIRLERGSAAEALPLFDASARELGRLATTRPEVWSNQAVAFGWLARAREHLGQLDAALAVQEQKLAALNAAKGSDGRDDSNSRYLRGVAMLDIARLQLALGRHAESVEAAAQATLELDALVERDPSNLDWLGQASFGRLRWAEARRASGDPVPARQACERVGRDLAPMLASDGGKLAWRIKLQGRWLAVCGPLDPGAEMPRALQRYLGTATAATADARRQLDPEQQTVLAEVMLLHGDQLAAAARTDEARAAWRRAAERVQTLASNDLQARAVLAQLRLRLGEVQVAAALSENLEGTSYRHPLLADLRRRLGREGRTGPGR